MKIKHSYLPLYYCGYYMEVSIYTCMCVFMEGIFTCKRTEVLVCILKLSHEHNKQYALMKSVCANI